MGKLIYGAIASLDGFIEDEAGTFGWAEPDEEVHPFINDLQRPVGTYLYGRRLYETMVVWETMPVAGRPSFIGDFGEIWRSADKIVYSTTLGGVSSERTRIEPRFEPSEIARLKGSTERDLAIGGPTLAAAAFSAGIVDELHLFLSPVLVGGGKRCLPDGVRLTLEPLDERRFGNGTVYLRYRTTGRG